jgi:hypothetical protein
MKKIVALSLIGLFGVTGLAVAQRRAAAPPRPEVAVIKQQPEPAGLTEIPAGAPQLPYHFVDRVVAPNGEKFGNVASVAYLPNGHLLVFNRNPAIMMVEYDATGTKALRVFNGNLAMNPHSIRVDRHGNIWAIDSFLNVIWKLDSKGDIIKTYGIRGENGPWDDTKWNGMFNQPLDIAFDKDDNIYVVQSHGGTSPPADCTFCATNVGANRGEGHAVEARPLVYQGSDPRLIKFDKNFNYLGSVNLAHPDGLLPVIHTVMVTPKGEVWVGDRASEKILVFDTSLKKLREIQEQNLTAGFYVDAKNQIWMSTGRSGMVLKLDPDGKVLGWYGKHGDNTDSNDIGEAHYMTVSPDEKHIFVADTVLAHVLHLEHN